MAVERIDPSRLMGVNAAEAAAFVESDFKIRSGLCPNGHGLMQEPEWGQQCPTCGFSTNVRAERGDRHG